ARARPGRRGKGGGGRGGRRAARGSLGDERPRDAARPRALPVDARGRERATADRDRADHRLARARGETARRAGAAARGAVRAREGEGGVLLVRVAVIGCGAVGSLFAANLAQLDDVEVWAYDAFREHVDAINAGGLRLSGAGSVVGTVHATTHPQELPQCELGIVATKAMHTSAAIAATAHAFATGAVASVQN